MINLVSKCSFYILSFIFLNLVSGDININALEYYKNQPSSIKAVTNYDDENNERELNTSIENLSKIMKIIGKKRFKHGLDAGCGIGRVTKVVLAPFIDEIDLFDSKAEYIDFAKEYLKDYPNYKYYVELAEKFVPEKEIYDVIWAQWIILYLDDSSTDLFLSNMKNALSKDGVIIIKENIDMKEQFIPRTGSFIRTEMIFENLFKKHNLKIIFLNKKATSKEYLELATYGLVHDYYDSYEL